MEASTSATRTAASVKNFKAEQVEEVAIALAITDKACHRVLNRPTWFEAKDPQRHHESLPHGSQDIPIPAPTAGSSGGGTIETATDWITTEHGPGTPHVVPRDIPDRQVQGLPLGDGRLHAHLVKLHQTPRGSKIKNNTVVARGSWEKLRPGRTALGCPAGRRGTRKARTQRAGNGDQRPVPSNGNTEDDVGHRRNVRAPNCGHK
ncbi:hypothetical protein HPB51_013892 [Rhipicephalus microplus]|uniref:Uncharacterized protein n=1 Tax=Rhipicephalus microplus TaxID=6941 RepID=A0A9J6EGY3_RHIMP|nr:hypothetical protein HPB51_013892 [Rhipicephalus microplus]